MLHHRYSANSKKSFVKKLAIQEMLTTHPGSSFTKQQKTSCNKFAAFAWFLIPCDWWNIVLEYWMCCTINDTTQLMFIIFGTTNNMWRDKVLYASVALLFFFLNLVMKNRPPCYRLACLLATLCFVPHVMMRSSSKNDHFKLYQYHHE